MGLVVAMLIQQIAVLKMPVGDALVQALSLIIASVPVSEPKGALSLGILHH
jgi:hypothetical protein